MVMKFFMIKHLDHLNFVEKKIPRVLINFIGHGNGQQRIIYFIIIPVQDVKKKDVINIKDDLHIS